MKNKLFDKISKEIKASNEKVVAIVLENNAPPKISVNQMSESDMASVIATLAELIGQNSAVKKKPSQVLNDVMNVMITNKM